MVNLQGKTTRVEGKMPESLGEHDPSLRDIYFIEGIGLCSNIFIFAEGESISFVDTGSGMESNAVTAQLERLGLEIEAVTRVVITHGHMDHIGGLTEICEHCSPKIFVHQNDADDLKSIGIKTVVYMEDGDNIRLGRRDLRVIHSPGHTEGSVCLHDDEIILTGDTAFPGGYFGRTDLPSGDWRKLVDSLDKLSRLDVRVMLPGHGEPLLSEASSHLKLARRTLELVRY
jgi:glyoxylase-like metal-dependent hydrolase (beta-lactamase superfamily II)